MLHQKFEDALPRHLLTSSIQKILHIVSINPLIESGPIRRWIFLECIGRSGCLAPSPFTDTCADIPSHMVVPLETIPNDALQGTWNKLYTSGWDIWPRQWTEFWPPSYLVAHGMVPPVADSWMTQWPNATAVWRMDLYWKNGDESDITENSSVTFHMDNEMYPDQTWNFSSTTTSATLSTRAVMWGTEAHENWYLLDYHYEWQAMMVYSCAYTEAVDRFDSMTMVLKRRQWDGASRHSSIPPYKSPIITTEQEEYYQRRALELLGKDHGNFQRVSTCNRNR